MSNDYYALPVDKPAPLSTADELALFRADRRRRTARVRAQIVKQYLHWAADLACRYCGPRFSKEAAISAANLGLMRAIESFNPDKGTRFVTHSFFPIRQAIIDDMRTESYTINPYPALNAAKYLYQKAGKTAAAREKLHTDRAEILESVNTVKNLTADNDTRSENDARDSVETSSLISVIREKVGLLAPQERRIVRLRYLGTDTMIFREIGEKLGLEEDHVRYVHDRAILKLRNLLKREL